MLAVSFHVRYHTVKGPPHKGGQERKDRFELFLCCHNHKKPCWACCITFSVTTGCSSTAPGDLDPASDLPLGYQHTIRKKKNLLTSYLQFSSAGPPATGCRTLQAAARRNMAEREACLRAMAAATGRFRWRPLCCVRAALGTDRSWAWVNRNLQQADSKNQPWEPA